MCGRGGAAGGVTMTSQRGCVGSTGRRLPQGVEKGRRALRRQAERKTGGPKSLEAENKELRARLRPWRRRKEQESKEDKDFHTERKRLGGRVGEGNGPRGWRSRVAKSWMSKGGNCRSGCETLKISRVCRKSFRKTSRANCNSSRKRWSQGGTTTCQNTRKCRKDRKRYKESRTKEEICRKTAQQQKRRCGSSKRSSIKKRTVSFSD